MSRSVSKIVPITIVGLGGSRGGIRWTNPHHLSLTELIEQNVEMMNAQREAERPRPRSNARHPGESFGGPYPRD